MAEDEIKKEISSELGTEIDVFVCSTTMANELEEKQGDEVFSKISITKSTSEEIALLPKELEKKL